MGFGGKIVRDIMKKMGDREYFFSGGGLLAAAMILQVLARNVSGMATWYAHHVYPVLVRVIGGFFWLFSVFGGRKSTIFSCFWRDIVCLSILEGAKTSSGENGIFDWSIILFIYLQLWSELLCGFFCRICRDGSWDVFRGGIEKTV